VENEKTLESNALVSLKRRKCIWSDILLILSGGDFLVLGMDWGQKGPKSTGVTNVASQHTILVYGRIVV
jgi:hypothetical protein